MSIFLSFFVINILDKQENMIESVLDNDVSPTAPGKCGLTQLDWKVVTAIGTLLLFFLMGNMFLVQETVGVCWPTAAPVPAGVKKEDSCAMESHCQPIVRDCDCYQSCEVRVEGSLIFAHDCPGGQACDTNHQQEIDCNTNILILKKLSQL